MQTRWMILAGAVIVAAFLAGRAVPQDIDPKEMDMAEAMKAWQEAATPGKHHAWLERFVGTWDVEMKMWMEPGAAPMSSKGTTETKWLMRGRWIISTTKLAVPMLGKDLESVRILGYDNFRRKFVEVMVDNMNTHMVTSSGNRSKDLTSLVTYGPMNDPMTHEIGKTVKYATRLVDDDTYKVEVYDLVIGEGDESKVLEFALKRRK